MGDNEKALDLLKSFSGSDDMISPAITGLIGDCYVNMGNVKEGISYFEKAAKQASNEVISPTYLKKAGIAYESLKNMVMLLRHTRRLRKNTSIQWKLPISTNISPVLRH